MAKPAASSAALLMRKPEDKRSKDWASEAFELVRLFCAFNEPMFVFKTNDIDELLKV
jgi:hypothetical protein